MTYPEEKSPRTRNSVLYERKNICIKFDEDLSSMSSFSANPESLFAEFTAESEYETNVYDNDSRIASKDDKKKSNTSSNNTCASKIDTNEFHQSSSNESLQSRFAFHNEDDEYSSYSEER